MTAETLNIYIRSLEYYSEKIRELVYDSEFVVNDYIKYDLNKKAGEIDRLSSTLREKGLYSDTKVGIKFTDVKDNRNMICQALKIYSDDLKSSIQAIRVRAGEFAQDIKFVETENEIKKVDAEYNEIFDKSAM